MIKQKLILPLMLLAVLAVLVSAISTVNLTFEEAVIQSGGAVVPTGVPVEGVSLIGFICSSPDCATVSGTLWEGATLFAQGSEYNITFPTQLASPHGYGVYVYKEFYIPFEISADLFGTQELDFTALLSKQESCTSIVSVTSVEHVGDLLEIEVLVESPLDNGGDLIFIPDQIEDQYEVETSVEVTVNGTDGSSVVMSETADIPYSGDVSFPFTVPALAGVEYSISATTSVPDSVCLESVPQTATDTFTVVDPSDIIPPGPVTDLAAEDLGSDFILWTWTNPSDEDFSHVIIFLDGLEVGTTDGESFNATGLLPETEHTITLNTVDFSGNVNPDGVSDTQTTQPLPDESDTTPPGTVTDLEADEITESSITWTWENPTDPDFDHAIIFIDGVHVADTASESYTAEDLDEDTSYTITIHTVDINGNINDTDVSDTATTDEEDDDDNDGGGSGHDSDDDLRFFEQPNEVDNDFVPIVFEDESPITLNKKTQSKGLNFWLIVLLIILIALILIIILLIAVLR